MTMDLYEQKYKDALGKLQEALAPTEDGCKISGLTRGCIENIFPELKESEHEKIRKAILQFFESQDDNTTYSFVSKKDILAWLEKQGHMLDPDKVIEWLNDQACQGWIEDVEVDIFVDNFKKDFGL